VAASFIRLLRACYSNQLDWLGTSRVLAGPIHVGSLNVTEEIT
jgi:hypothetical protein